MASRRPGRYRFGAILRTRTDDRIRGGDRRRAIDIYERLAIALRERRAPRLVLVRAKGN